MATAFPCIVLLILTMMFMRAFDVDGFWYILSGAFYTYLFWERVHADTQKQQDEQEWNNLKQAMFTEYTNKNANRITSHHNNVTDYEYLEHMYLLSDSELEYQMFRRFSVDKVKRLAKGGQGISVNLQHAAQRALALKGEL